MIYLINEKSKIDKHKEMASNTKIKHGQRPKEKEEKLTELAQKIDETDEMKLKMLAAMENPEPEDLLYPAELNAHLIEQLKVMFYFFELFYY